MAMFENLYIHVPFCTAKCGYCAFYSLPQAGLSPMEHYLEAMERELEEFSRGETLDTLYFGGGTPTVLPLPLLENLLAAVSSSYRITPQTEVTMECNPETLSPVYIDILRSIVNRVSMGVQTFSPRLRKILSRRGTGEEAEHAIQLLRRGGIENISLDLIYAIPGQTLNDWESDLRRAAETGVNHMSCYSLTLEPGTPLAQELGEHAIDEELSAEMWQAAGEFLSDFGLERYEVSNYAVPHWECRHNMNVWHGHSYLGLGPAASSFNGLARWTEPANLEQWLSGAAPIRDELTPSARAREVFAFGLRTVTGWRREQWEELPRRLIAGRSWEKLLNSEAVDKLQTRGLLDVTADQIRPTEKGIAFWNDVAEELI